MTSAALTSNREWNTKVVSTEKGEDRALLISATGERGIFVTGGRNLGFIRVCTGTGENDIIGVWASCKSISCVCQGGS